MIDSVPRLTPDRERVADLAVLTALMFPKAVLATFLRVNRADKLLLLKIFLMYLEALSALIALAVKIQIPDKAKISTPI